MPGQPALIVAENPGKSKGLLWEKQWKSPAFFDRMGTKERSERPCGN
jgi:hypothetical protein